MENPPNGFVLSNSSLSLLSNVRISPVLINVIFSVVIILTDYQISLSTLDDRSFCFINTVLHIVKPPNKDPAEPVYVLHENGESVHLISEAWHNPKQHFSAAFIAVLFPVPLVSVRNIHSFFPPPFASMCSPTSCMLFWIDCVTNLCRHVLRLVDLTFLSLSCGTPLLISPRGKVQNFSSFVIFCFSSNLMPSFVSILCKTSTKFGTVCSFYNKPCYIGFQSSSSSSKRSLQWFPPTRDPATDFRMIEKWYL